MGKRVTIADVAAQAGVSKGAVSFALNDRPGLADDTRARILEVADELGWRPSSRARALSTSRALALGLVLARPPELLGADPFFPAFIAGVETVLSQRGQALVLQVVPDLEAEAEGYRRLVSDGRVDGVFLLDLRVHEPRVQLLESLGLPAVTLNKPDSPSSFPAVCSDSESGIRRAVEHLLALGHRRVAHVAGPDEFAHAARRRAGWESALAEACVPPGPVVVCDFSAEGGARATRELLALADPPTAVVYANDVMAIAGLAVAAELGVKVPDELSVVGYDDTLLAAHVHPPLTTVSVDALAWGAQAAQTLLTYLEHHAADDVLLPPATLVVRGSTGPAPTR
ncbi:DNA-binding LacI/PurR family transcriptional regulator [Motilibacter peucedani]|uniref:DNA-binding LacI/PurR family transcriptional regulator n=1 Tax=Motilibacter peucedani TaxID=598650 RepID=A0A420XLS4_9ACTN|nr:LacI family DNA-binding transcriptional regulator [Motilibacter peucedani]RKS71442.1 DNA-binding LacI/PurR family transcriptional regulator [Motilibacter peucedani]